MNFATVLASRISSRSPSLHTADSRDESASIASSHGTYSSGSSQEGSSLSLSFETRSCISDPGCISTTSSTRPNEHLAVLLPKHLWKPDPEASHCDVFLCRKAFSLRVRKHHCRKCGGIFCGNCSARSTALLDTSNLTFFHPPRDTPISEFETPASPIVIERVCDHCWDQVHGVRTPRSPIMRVATSIAVLKEALADSDSASSTSSLATPSDASSPILRPSLCRSHTTSPRMPSSPLRSPVPWSQALGISHVADAELSSDLGELQAYPLRRASIICKATGGGRWEPKQLVNLTGHRLPGMKAPYEIELEREEAERRRRKANPVIVDGDFQVRVPRELEPHSPAGPIRFSTF